MGFSLILAHSGCRNYRPSCAGSTQAASSGRGTRSLPPLVRGEHPTNEFQARNPFSTAPRARGAPTVQGTCARSRPYRPSCAGSTQPASSGRGTRFRLILARVWGASFQLGNFCSEVKVSFPTRTLSSQKEGAGATARRTAPPAQTEQ